MMENRGAFANPANRALGYRVLIGQLLRDDVGNRMPDGSLVPDGNIQLATELFRQAEERGVWNTRDIFYAAQCARQGAAVEEMLKRANERVTDDFLSRYDVSDLEEADDSQYLKPRDQYEAIEHAIRAKDDFRIVKIKA